METGMQGEYLAESDRVYGCARRTRCPTSTECHGMPWDFAWPEVLAQTCARFPALRARSQAGQQVIKLNFLLLFFRLQVWQAFPVVSSCAGEGFMPIFMWGFEMIWVYLNCFRYVSIFGTFLYYILRGMHSTAHVENVGWSSMWMILAWITGSLLEEEFRRRVEWRVRDLMYVLNSRSCAAGSVDTFGLNTSRGASLSW